MKKLIGSPLHKQYKTLPIEERLASPKFRFMTNQELKEVRKPAALVHIFHDILTPNYFTVPSQSHQEGL